MLALSLMLRLALVLTPRLWLALALVLMLRPWLALGHWPGRLLDARRSESASVTTPPRQGALRKKVSLGVARRPEV